MNAIQQALESFMAIDPPEAFESNFHDIFRPLTHGSTRIIGNELVHQPPYEAIEDLAIVSEIDRFIADLIQWIEAVEETREEYFQECDSLVLPEDLRSVFGNKCNEFEVLRDRCRRILRFIGKIDKLPDFNESKEKALTLYNTTELSWTEIAETLGEFPGKDFEAAIRRYAGSRLIKRLPGRKKGRK